MRVFIVGLLAFLSRPALAADLTVKVLDPHGAAVLGAQVQLLADQSKIVSTQITSATPTSLASASTTPLATSVPISADGTPSPLA